jgi:hypothetical protein
MKFGQRPVDGRDVTDFLNTSHADIVLRGRITLCDLAGSERMKKSLVSGAQLMESQQINLSLLELGNVISALSSRRPHVPFRNSTLTRLLQESLGGNCKTQLVICVSPCRKDISETKGSLAFGSRAMRVSNNARVNVEIDYKVNLKFTSNRNELSIDFIYSGPCRFALGADSKLDCGIGGSEEKAE